ncbi:TIGR04282 family arsenosugar biosynthesis glycosyltransferase [Streptomyces bobili]|uniref:TIGR04282 family arsenosugar biosynthesis glycosyltransferase n=1 Tax=Streptomyces bobili TaxID=67280 RepID=UPI0033A393AB
MRIGVITGSGNYDWPHLEGAAERTVVTDHGAVTVTEGRLKDTEIVQLSRHGAGHHRLSSQADHKANLAALLARETEALVSFTVCGSLDPDLRPGSLVVFDDLYFPANRLPDGAPCTWYDTPGEAGRGHWIFERPFSEPLRQALITAAAQTGAPVVTRGVYGHADGPRFNSRPEVAALAAAGVSAVSQTGGPEVVLAGGRTAHGAGRFRHRLRQRRRRRTGTGAGPPGPHGGEQGGLRHVGRARAACPGQRERRRIRLPVRRVNAPAHGGTPAILVMAKAPRPGTVKTRLHPLLGPRRCAELQAELIRHTLELATAHTPRTYLAYAPGDGEDTLSAAVHTGVRLLLQRGEDLGQRLAAAVTGAFADGAGPLLVIGTDAPTLNVGHLTDAFTTLEDQDVTLGPALDGGYYLIGLRAPRTSLFNLGPNVWSTERVLTATRALARGEGLSTQLLSPLRDLDTPQDAAALLPDPALPAPISALLQPVESP